MSNTDTNTDLKARKEPVPRQKSLEHEVQDSKELFYDSCSGSGSRVFFKVHEYVYVF